ncbi:hypothetical protein CapIbe_018645 [Capra ibex]
MRSPGNPGRESRVNAPGRIPEQRQCGHGSTGVLESFPRAQSTSFLISTLHSSQAVLKGSGFSHQRPSRERSQNRSIQVKDGGDQPPKPAPWRDGFHPACSSFNRV